MEEEIFVNEDESGEASTKVLQNVDILLTTTERVFKNESELLFSTFDYTIFGIMLALSALIGVYFGFISKKKQNNTNEYLLGGKQMNFFPIAASLIASHVSGITLLGIPAEMYANGTQYGLFFIPAIAVSLSMIYIYLPVFYELQLTSSFTYLEKRFDRSVRLTASIIYTISCIIFIPIVIYVPALAFSQVTGINLYIVTPIITIICIFYTTVGGLKAVVWTDTLQFLLMVVAIIAVITLGLLSVGGVTNVWEAAERGKRLIFFNMDPNPFVRTSFWTVSLGLTTMWISNLGVNQGCVQRFLAVPDIKFAKKSVWIFCLGLIFTKITSCIIGLIIFAKYETCDPITTKQIEKLDQVLPYFVMEVAGKIPGLPGLFVAGIFSAALSSLSSSLNTLAGTLYEDFVRHNYPNNSEKLASDIMKLMVVVIGIIVMGLVFIVEHLGAVFHLAIALSGVTAGSLLGIFTLGMISRKANTKGVISGAIASMVVVGFIMVGATVSGLKYPKLPMRTDGCDFAFNVTNSIPTPIDHSQMPLVFQLSFMYYALLGVIVLFAVGYPVSYLTGGCQEFDEILLTPFCRKKGWKNRSDNSKNLRKDVQYAELDLALAELKKIASD